MQLKDFTVTAQGQQKIQAFEAGRAAWRALDLIADILVLPENPYGDEWENPLAQSFRAGFEAAARRDGYTYSRVDGMYTEGGEFETDEFEQL